MTASAWPSGNWSRRTASGGSVRRCRRWCGSDLSHRRRNGSWSAWSLKPTWPPTPRATTGNRSANSWWEFTSSVDQHHSRASCLVWSFIQTIHSVPSSQLSTTAFYFQPSLPVSLLIHPSLSANSVILLPVSPSRSYFPVPNNIFFYVSVHSFSPTVRPNFPFTTYQALLFSLSFPSHLFPLPISSFLPSQLPVVSSPSPLYRNPYVCHTLPNFHPCCFSLY